MQEQEQPRLIIISAPSGAGKTTLCEKLVADFENITLSISSTTRPPRSYELEGVHYKFLSHDQFEQKISRNEFAEWAEVHGHLYGTEHSAIESALAQNKHLLFDIDVQGAMSLRKAYGSRTLLIFIHPPSIEKLQERLVKRSSDTASSIETRLTHAYDELNRSSEFDYQVLNDSLGKAYDQLTTIIKKECR